MFKTRSLVCAALFLTACGAPKPQANLEHGTSVSPAEQATTPAPGAGVFRIDAARSDIRLLVHRAGAMARLGHNHVISNHALGGWVKYSGELPAAAFSFRIPVRDFVVDDARMRSEEGQDFSEDVPEDAKTGTKHNMLSEDLLDAEHFPAIAVTSTSVTQTGGTMTASVTASVTVSVAGRQSILVVPFTLATEQGRLTASGSVNLKQSALGLTPFSVMLGALQVQDEFTVKFNLVAVPT